MAGIELENVPKFFAPIADKTWPVVGIVYTSNDVKVGT
jgi:hypothetical protein